MSRTRSQQIAVETPFGKMYIILEYDRRGRTTGAWIAHPKKHETTPIAMLIESLSDGFNDALKGLEV
jgi:hypothetical protein